MSPFIFVLCIKRLSHIINKAVADGSWKGIRVTKDSQPISHIMFADDMVLFSEATKGQMEVIKNCLDSFCRMSGQRVNY